ncbi:alpha-amylase family glycosyl hydrolase [Zavarzinella formosa]|uniref:alpha-amylase family glycosyl hydrolase n=1 Tax=Zavarzinella formosa TaxID=360055 RepID=UPI0003079C44|nr:alpha-amylase family glycosyl hydrolase [Zavarzinella formosa]
MDPQERLGAWLTPLGCYFRVWAPHAAAVTVLVQDGPYWEITDTILRGTLQKDGEYWTATVPGVQAWQLYRFELTLQDGSILERLDPAARDVLSSELTRHDPSSRNGSVVQGTDPFPWAPFDTPRFENFLIYQAHVGSFAGRGDEFDKLISTFEDIESKLSYVREMGFNCIQLLPVHEFAMDRSWGYNPASFFAPESAYGSPYNLRHFVDAAHRQGLAVIFDVVYNHAGPGDNVLYEYDGYANDNGGIYFEGGQDTWWGRGPAWWKRDVQEFFYQNARMFLDEYHGDGLRFDVTTQINGDHLKLVMARLRQDFPGKYFVAEHLPSNPWIVNTGHFCATWHADSHHECQRALAGQDPMNKVRGFLGWDGYDHPWNLVKYTLGSHDDIGDQENGNAEHGLTDWDKRHRYFVDQVGGRQDWSARAKCRLAWALNIAMPGTPLMFMGSECLMASPDVSWGYWHDGPDANGDHRFNWHIAGDDLGMEMRRLVAASNAVRWQNPALRADSLTIPHEDATNQVLGFVRQAGGNLVLTVVNLGDQNFSGNSYGVATGGQFGQWTQILCTQDAAFGGWGGAGNAFSEPWTQADGRVYINLPKWSVVMFRRK